MRQARHDNALHVREDRVEALGLLRRFGRQLRLDVPRPHARHHRPLGNAFTIVRNPVDQAMTEFSKLVRSHARFSVRHFGRYGLKS